MKDLALPAVDGYHPDTQRILAYLAASLDDQLRRIKDSVAELSVEALEWQEAPGRNTVGMLLAHMAVAEAWWINAGAMGITEGNRADEILRGVIGIGREEDGMPLAPGAAHPDILRGKALEDYLAMLDRARATTHAVLRTWRDVELGEAVDVRDRKVTYGWILYHVLEHTVAHYGQLLLLLRIRQDRAD